MFLANPRAIVHARRLHVMKDRGVLDRVSRGVFRFPDVPAGALDQYVAAMLRPLEVRGVLSHATALDLHELCEVNPSRIDVGWNLIEQAIDTGRRRGRLTAGQADELRAMRHAANKAVAS